MNDEQIPDWAKTWYYDKGFAEAEEFWRFEERERIIKLLEEYLSAFGAPQEQLMQRRMTDFIALIKGEKQ